MKYISSRKKIAFLLVVVSVLVALIMVIGLVEQKVNKTGNSFSDKKFPDSMQGKDDGRVFYQSSWYAPKKNLETMLFLGIDHKGNISDSKSSQQSDFLVLVAIDHAEKTVQLLHLNRDTMTDIPQTDIADMVYGTVYGQLALAHAYGSNETARCQNAMRAVKNLLYGVAIDHYMAITMDAVAILNDSLGGVTLPLLEDFTFIDPTYTKGTVVTLTGEDALQYVRSRSVFEDSSNLSRMERQRQYINALFAAYVDENTEMTKSYLKLIIEIGPYMASDYTANQLSKLSETMQEYTYKEILSIPGEAKVGDPYMEYYIDEKAAQDIVISMFYEKCDDGAQDTAE